MRRALLGLFIGWALLALGACSNSDDPAELSPSSIELGDVEPPAVEDWGSFEVLRYTRNPAVDTEEGVGFVGTLDFQEGTRCLTMVSIDGTSAGREIVAIPREVEISIESDGAIVGSFGMLVPGDTVIFGVSAVGGLAPGETIGCDANTPRVLWTSANGWGRRVDSVTGRPVEPRRP